ncbi:hypothetical protein MSAN_01982800 [Mycena sanguinolenta]|uniref:Uncharacterized protein n=1 Tax=Mycena sanguinolenta TaxID=230812 RepID=A0A8H6XM80_9AGAR|nr:hypothetical protein MSAN_01982800 [Mycena sanguinolenta]
MNPVNDIPIDPALLVEDAAVRAAADTSASKPKKGAAHWTVPDEAKLLVILIEHLTEAGDGANFTATVWNASATESAPPKTPALQSHKRAAAEPAASTAKKPRSRVEEMPSKAFTSKPATDIPPTLVRLKTAIKCAQQLEKWLVDWLVIFLEVLENSKNAVDIYDSLEDNGDLLLQSQFL